MMTEPGGEFENIEAIAEEDDEEGLLEVDDEELNRKYNPAKTEEPDYQKEKSFTRTPMKIRIRSKSGQRSRERRPYGDGEWNSVNYSGAKKLLSKQDYLKELVSVKGFHNFFDEENKRLRTKILLMIVD